MAEIPQIDPTQNVRELFAADGRLRDALREADNRYQDAMREAETRRLNELAAQKQLFDLELAKILRANQEAAAALLATQLKEVKTDLSVRTTVLETSRNENTGASASLQKFIGWIVAGVVVVGGVVAMLAKFSN